jgi:hypothetical protein
MAQEMLPGQNQYWFLFKFVFPSLYFFFCFSFFFLYSTGDELRDALERLVVIWHPLVTLLANPVISHDSEHRNMRAKQQHACKEMNQLQRRFLGPRYIGEDFFRVEIYWGRHFLGAKQEGLTIVHFLNKLIVSCKKPSK